MKATEIQQAKDEVQSIREFPKEKKYLGSLRSISGLTVFEMNIKDRTIIPAEFESVIKMDGTKHRKIVIKENCVYIQALNKQNAFRKFKKKVAKK